MVTKRKRRYKEVVTESAPPVKPDKTKPVKRDWQKHARDQLKK